MLIPAAAPTMMFSISVASCLKAAWRAFFMRVSVLLSRCHDPLAAASSRSFSPCYSAPAPLCRSLSQSPSAFSPSPVGIKIPTARPSALVDRNGPVPGSAPITIEPTPFFYQYASHYTWPSKGARTQRFLARWPDGAMNTPRRGCPPHEILCLKISLT